MPNTIMEIAALERIEDRQHGLPERGEYNTFSLTGGLYLDF